MTAHKGRGRDDRREGRAATGDWICPKCSNSNFSFRTECNTCGEPRGTRLMRLGMIDRRRAVTNEAEVVATVETTNEVEVDATAETTAEVETDATAETADEVENFATGPRRFGGDDRRGGDRRDGNRRFGGDDRRGGGRSFDKNDRRGPREPRNFGGGDRRGPRQDRDFRNEGRGDGDRRGGDRRGPRQDRGNGGKSRIRPKGPFRQARGKSGGHAHNRGPKPIRRTRRDDD